MKKLHIVPILWFILLIIASWLPENFSVQAEDKESAPSKQQQNQMNLSRKTLCILFKCLFSALLPVH